ncbi:hypothetical protein [Arcobacter roscoffensis]|uniref:DUF1090 domain-containing protein n=1 Tax=Arcobacter roscoffensis TaxID=2961520 RepID=A0ABY5E4A6_9BACT|nr:hypothetical protein [Arcobacter roscoffensis]UTJ05600.1 hypothetical protein NJU99_10015 [Arcobacter roscoffensis]
MKKQIINIYMIFLIILSSTSWANNYKEISSSIVTGQYLSCKSLRAEIEKTQKFIDNLKNNKTENVSLAKRMQLNNEEKKLRDLKDIEISKNCY